MGEELPEWVRRGLSEARIQPYLVATDGSVEAALRLYWWNVSVSEAFHPALHVIEVALRNVLHERLRTYDHSLWVPALHRAFPGYRGRRGQLHDWLLSVVYFRNRIAHHEHIHTRDLAADLAKIRRLLGYFSPDLLVRLDAVDRVGSVLVTRP